MKNSVIMVLAVLPLLGAVAWSEERMIKGFFNASGTGLSFVADGWSVRSEDGRGWVSLQVKGAEFLSAIVFQKNGQFATHFPDHSNLSHDRLVGRVGAVSDGMYLVKITPNATATGFQLYAGYNAPDDQKLVLFLNNDVAIQRAAKAVTFAHKTGASLVTTSPCWAGVMKDPAGKERPAAVFDTKGFAANAFDFVIESARPLPSFAGDVAFSVRSSDDPPDNVLGATRGVKNPVYGRDTKLDFAIELTRLRPEPFTGYAELEIHYALGARHYYERQDLNAVQPDDKGRVIVRFSPKFTVPGVSEVWGRAVDATGSLIWVDRYRMAYDYEGYRPKLMVEPDFKAFWEKTLAELRATPLEPVTERVKEFADHPRFEIYDVTYNGWNKQRSHAMLFVLKDLPRPAPAIVTAHPGTTGFGVSKRPDGVYGSEVKQDPRFVTIVPLIRGHAPDAKDIPFNHPWWGPLHDRDAYVARAWYCAMVRAVDYLATRPELVDMKRIVARGGSQGGALALVTAGLDPRVTVCLADCPANCQPHEIMENYPSFGPSKGQVPPGQTLQDVEKMLSYYNPVNFCPLVRCPTYVGSNIGDLTVHSMGPLAAYHNLRGLEPKEKAFYPGFTHFHGSGPGLDVKSREWLEKLAGTGTVR